MAKYLGPVCKLCRREGEKLFLKGERCFTPHCSFEKRSFAPGQHGRTGSRSNRGGTGRESDYARQLRAKQKARRVTVFSSASSIATLKRLRDAAV